MIEKVTITTIKCDSCDEVICRFDRGSVVDSLKEANGIIEVVGGKRLHLCSRKCSMDSYAISKGSSSKKKKETKWQQD